MNTVDVNFKIENPCLMLGLKNDAYIHKMNNIILLNKYLIPHFFF